MEQRLLGNNRYEIVNTLKPKLKQFCPSPSRVYNICKRNGLNCLNKKMGQKKRKIIRQKAGELGHADYHYLPKGILKDSNERLSIAIRIHTVHRRMGRWRGFGGRWRSCGLNCSSVCITTTLNVCILL